MDSNTTYKIGLFAILIIGFVAVGLSMNHSKVNITKASNQTPQASRFFAKYTAQKAPNLLRCLCEAIARKPINFSVWRKGRFLPYFSDLTTALFCNRPSV